MPGNPIIPLNLFLIVVLTSGCFSSKLTISVLEPSDITLPAWIQKVSILPVPGVPEPPGEFDSLKYIRLGLTTNTKEIKMGYLHGIYDEMIASPRFQKVVLNDQAALWISFADSLHSNKATSFYKKVLKERLDNKVKLDEQLAGN